MSATFRIYQEGLRVEVIRWIMQFHAHTCQKEFQKYTFQAPSQGGDPPQWSWDRMINVPHKELLCCLNALIADRRAK